jgi:hypothetical protein
MDLFVGFANATRHMDDTRSPTLVEALEVYMLIEYHNAHAKPSGDIATALQPFDAKPHTRIVIHQ